MSEQDCETADGTLDRLCTRTLKGTAGASHGLLRGLRHLDSRRHLDSQEASAWFTSLSPKDLPSCHRCDLEAALQGAPWSWELDPWGGPCPSPVPARPLRPACHFLCPLLFLLPPFLTIIFPHSSAPPPFSSPLFPLPYFFIPVSLPPCLVFISSLSPLLPFLAPSTCSNMGFFLLSPEARV